MNLLSLLGKFALNLVFRKAQEAIFPEEKKENRHNDAVLKAAKNRQKDGGKDHE